MSAEKAVPHIAKILMGARCIAVLRSHVCHRVGGSDKAGVGSQIEMKALSESVNSVVSP